MVRTTRPNQECPVVAFYGLNPVAGAVRTWYFNALEWFDEVGCSPDKLSFEGEGFSEKVRSFAREHAKVQGRGFEEIRGFSLFSLSPGGTIPLRDWKVTTELSLEESLSYVSFAADWDVTSFHNDGILNVARDLVELFQPDYGIGYRRERARGPDLFVVGMSGESRVLTGAEYEEAVRNTRWADTAMEERVYRNGILRDVFPWNFLTKFQLSARIEGITLREWIGADPARGILERFAGAVSLWKVDERQMRRVRKALSDAGLIFRV